MVVYRQEVVLEGQRSAEALLEVVDSLLGKMNVDSVDQLVGHQPHVLEGVALDAIALCRMHQKKKKKHHKTKKYIDQNSNIS